MVNQVKITLEKVLRFAVVCALLVIVGVTAVQVGYFGARWYFSSPSYVDILPNPARFNTFRLVSSDNWPTIVSPLTKQVPRLEILTEQGGGTCSGVVLSSDHILTAGHCVPASKALSVTVNGKHAEVARVNHILDLAVLKVKLRGWQPMPLAEKNPTVGSEVAAAGFLLGSKDLHVQFGRVSAFEDHKIVVNVQVLPGDSGGPLVDTQGRLVGMTQGYYVGSSVTIGAHVEAIRDFVEDFLPEQ
jgi:S1-C subfamily serine protease